MDKNFLKHQVAWKRGTAPIIAPGGEYGLGTTMNPWVVLKDDDIYLFYASSDSEGKKQIRLVIFENGDFDKPKNIGPVIKNGVWGSFDGNWCVLPHVIKVKDKWHMYYSGNRGIGEGLARFPGLGLAISDDLIHWEKYSDEPLLKPSGVPGDPDAAGIAGGGIITLPDGTLRWYYTGCPTVGEEHFINQQKNMCLAESKDGIHWEKKGAVITRIYDRDYKDIASTGGPLLYEDGMFKIWHSAIGSRWGFYSINYAESEDGINWNVGECYGDELALGPRCRHLDTTQPHAAWDGHMVAYPAVFVKDGRKHMFHCGNGYGAGGIGLSVACNSRVFTRGTELIILKDGKQYPLSINVKANGVEIPKTNWARPDSDCNTKREAPVDGGIIRIIVTHTLNGLKIFVTPLSEGKKITADVEIKAEGLIDMKETFEVCEYQTKEFPIEIEY